MAKTTLAAMTTTIKRLADYDISDTDLDNLILECINLAIKRMKQWFMDAELYDEIGAHDTFSTTANQEYIAIATETVDFDQLISLTERTNDSPIEIISFKEYRERYPDPSADASSTPEVAAFFANRIYLGPTPSSVITLYLDYIKIITKLVAGNSLPYEDKYDELVIAIVMEYLAKWFDRKDRSMILTAKEDVLQIKNDLITGASRNIGMNRQSESRRQGIPYFAPKKVIT